MPWHEPFPSKVRRHIQKHISRAFPRSRYFITDYLGASFLTDPGGIGTLELEAKIRERPELTHLMERCAALKPHAFIDVGANIGLYSCILLVNNAVPRAILFEPDRVNRIQLNANLLINGLLDRAEVHGFALGEENTQLPLVPGAVAKGEYAMADGGFSMIVDAEVPEDAGSYMVEVARFDDRFDLSGQTLAIKFDIEHYECRALAGMERTLRANRCIVQVESYILRAEVEKMMAGFGYKQTCDFMPNFVFENG